MELIVTTQYTENYGSRWKTKGNNKYAIVFEYPDGQPEGQFLDNLVERAIKRLTYKNDVSEEYVIDWYVTEKYGYKTDWDRPNRIVLGD